MNVARRLVGKDNTDGPASGVLDIQPFLQRTRIGRGIGRIFRQVGC